MTQALRDIAPQSWRQCVAGCLVALLLAVMPGFSQPVAGALGTASIRVLGLAVEVDTRPDLPGIQSTMTAVKDVPTGVLSVVGAGAFAATGLPPGARVLVDMSGPALGTQVLTLSALPNQLIEVPPLGAAGVHRIFNVRLVDASGAVLLRRDPSLAPVIIDVIDELLVTQVTSRPLSLEEIQDKGIVIDEDNFTAFNFAIGLTLGSEQVQIDLPVAIPTTAQARLELRPPDFTRLPSVTAQFSKINIPNFSISGFQLRVPPDVEADTIDIPPINGVIVIPGNIAFLNQFFSVVLQATNVAPEGSGLVLRNARARIVLPAGEDEILETGDDPLRIAETQSAGVQDELPLIDLDGSDSIAPRQTNDAEFLVEGLREGTHAVNFDIEGDLFVPSLGESVPMTGTAAGVVQVKNPTFSMVLAHPDVVREGEAYSLFVTVTNTSVFPANLFQLRLNSRSLSGARLAEGEDVARTLEQLLPGDAQTFEYRLVARTTGEVTGTVFLADEGINGSFILNTGVGDTGIPLSPDTLVLPQTVDYLPDDPDLVFAAVRLLGQGYSVATAPAGALPPEIARISRGHVFERAVKVAQAGLHVRFGESTVQAAEDIAMDWLGNDLARIDTLYEGDEAAAGLARRDIMAFDALRRAADAGHDFSDTLAALLGEALDTDGVASLQAQWASDFASRPAHLSFGLGSRGPPVELQLVDGAGAVLGRLDPADDIVRDVPYAARFALTALDQLLFVASPGHDYRFAFRTHGDGEIAPSLVLPHGDGMLRVTYPHVNLPAGAIGELVYERDAESSYEFVIDTDGDGQFDLVLAPDTVETVVDRPPRILGVQQWGRGAEPRTIPTFEHGDPIGRMVGVLFSEEVDADDAGSIARYQVAGNVTRAVSLQPDSRLVFVVLERPVGPFVPRDLTAMDIRDVRGNVMSANGLPIADDPGRTTGGTFAGRVVGPDGTPIPFAEVRYLQPLAYRNLFDACNGDDAVNDFVITTLQADVDGRFAIDYVLRAEFPSTCPTNPDIWLNQNNARGTSNFKLEAVDPVTGNIGRASSRISFDGQRQSFDVIIRGFGAIRGTLRDEDGNVVTGGAPGSTGSLEVRAHNVSTGEILKSWVDEQGGYALPRSIIAASGEEIDVPAPSVGNVILSLVRSSDGATAVATVNIPEAGASVTQDLILVPSTRYGTVTGRVLEVDGTTGAANVPVQIAADVLTAASAFGRSFSQGVVGSTTTDADGFFRFEQVPTGDIELRALRQATYEQVEVRAFLDEGATRDVTLVFPGSGGTVQGIVRDALGNAVANAVVGAGPVVGRSDASGFFELNGLPLGSFTVFAQGPGSPAIGQESVDSLGPDDVQSVVITLQAVGAIRGTLREADGVTPIAGQKVQLWVGTQGVMAETVTDADGNYAFVDYPVNEYTLRAVRGNRGDGGQAFTAIRFAGDQRDADITLRGLGEITGRVVQSNGTPAITDVIVTRKVWRVIVDAGAAIPNPYLDFIKELGNVDEALRDQVDAVLRENGLDRAPPEYYMLFDESALISSDERGPNGEVTGRFRFEGPATGGAFTVAAFGPFLSPAEVSGAIPVTTVPAERIVDVGDIVLEPSVGRAVGTVYLPDGVTPVGANVAVKIRSLDNSGRVQTAGGSVSQPVLPEIDALTDANGQFEFPIVLRGSVVITADTGAPDPQLRADEAASMRTDRFTDADGERVLNVRLFGQSNGVVPRGETATIDVRLRDVAGVDVQVMANDGVTPVPFAEVSLMTRSNLDGPVEPEFARQFADGNGFIRFFPVIEGAFSVSARDPGTPARGGASGVVPENPDNGHVETVQVTLGAVTTASGQVVQASIFGVVEGTVFSANGEVLTNPAEVRVSSSGVDILSTTDENGRYRAEDVPGGYFAVEVFEPFTARRGSAGGRIVSDGEVVEVPVTLVGLGSVSGEVFNNEGTRMLAAVDVVLTPSGNFTDRIVSRTDGDGRFALPGVPLGTYVLNATDPASGLTGTASDVMRADGDRNTTDVFLEASGTISGTVYAPGVLLDGAGQPVDGNGQVIAGAPVVAGASVDIQGQGFAQSVQTDAHGEFRSGQFLRLGSYSLTARPVAGEDGAFASTRIGFEGQDANVAMVLAGSGDVEGRVVDPVSGAPEAAARVTLASSSPFSAGPTTRFTDADGRFVFTDVPVGDYSLSVKSTLRNPQLGASVSDRVDAHGDVLAWLDGDADTARDAIRLQDTGSVTGRVLLDDGVTPAGDAIVEIRGAGIVISRNTDASGVFTFEGLPLAGYTVNIIEPLSDGIAVRSAALSSNGETLDLGEIVVDTQPPAVVSTAPAASAADVHPTEPIVVTFSELIDPASVDAVTFDVRIDGEAVSGTLQVDAVLPVVRFFPAQPFPDLQRVEVRLAGDVAGFEGQVIESGISDREGIGMAADVRFAFTTSDSTPPSLLGVSPPDGADEVALRSVVRVEFTEPVELASIDGFTLSTGGSPVSGVVNDQPILGGRVVVFTPQAPLLPNARYDVDVTGAIADRVGNVYLGGVHTTFTTIDTLAPVIQALSVPPDAPLVFGAVLALDAALEDDGDVARVDFFVNGELLSSDDTAPFVSQITLDPALGSAPVLSAVAEDHAGNRSVPRTLALSVASNRAPEVRLVAPAAGTEVAEGEVIALVVEADDDIGVAQLSFTANGGAAGSGIRNFAGTDTQVQHAFGFLVPAGLAVGSEIRIRAGATDGAGLGDQTADRVLVVVDRTAPAVSISSPLDGAVLEPGAAVNVLVRGDDPGGIAELALAVSGGLDISLSRAFANPQTPAVHAFDITIPADAQPNVPITLTARATDAFGNTGERVIAVAIADRVPPQVAIVNPASRTEVEPGDSVPVTVRASDSIGVAGVELIVENAATQAASGAGETSVERVFAVTVPAAQPFGSSIRLVPAAEDSSGNRSSGAEVFLDVRDLSAPVASILAPAANATVIAGTDLVVDVSASDNDRVASIAIAVSGAFDHADQFIADPPLANVSHRFTVPVPDSAQANALVNISVTAIDSSGRGSAPVTRTLRIADTAPARVLSVVPADGASGVDPAVNVVVEFDEPLAPASVDGASVTLSRSDGGAVEGSVALGAGNTRVTFDPAADLAAGSEFVLRLGATITDVAGNALISALESRFTTVNPDVTGPRLLELTPADGARDVPIRPLLRAVFDEALVLDTGNPLRIELHDGDGNPVALEQSLVDGGRTLQAAPLQPLAFNSPHAMVLTGSARDAAGNAVTDVNGDPVDAVAHAFVTTGFGIVRPRTGDLFREGDAIEIEAVVAGAGIASVEFLADGVSFASSANAPFVASLAAPAPDGSSVLVLTAVARAADGSELARDEVVVELYPVLSFESRLEGAPLGVLGGYPLRLSSPAPEAVTVTLSVADPAVLGLSATQLTFDAGETVGLVFVRGTGIGATTLSAESIAGDAHIVVSVSEDTEGVSVALQSPIVGALVPAPARPVLPIRLTGIGAHPVVLPLLAGAADGDRLFAASSSDTGVFTAPASVTVADGSTVASLVLNAVANGEATLRLVRDGELIAIPVLVGPAPGGAARLTSASVGTGVQNPRPPRPLQIGSTGSVQVWLPVLGQPAASAIAFTITSSDPDVVSVAPTAEVPAATTMLALSLSANASGDATLVLASGRDVFEVPVRVGALAGGIGIQSQPTGVGVRNRVPPRPMAIGSPGLAVVSLTLLAEPAAEDVLFDVTSSDPDVLGVPAQVLLPAGSRVLSLTLDALALGTATITLSDGRDVHRLPVEVGGSGAAVGVQSQPAGIAVLAHRGGGAVAIGGAGSYPLLITVLDQPAGEDLQVTLESSDGAVLQVPATATIAAGSTVVAFTVEALADGEAEIRVALPDGIVALRATVDPLARPGVLTAQSVGLAVREAGSAGTVYADPGASFDLEVPLLQVPATQATRVDIFSRSPGVVDSPVAAADIPAGETSLTLPLIVNGADGSSAVIELRVGGVLYTLRVIAGIPLPEDVPVTIAPTVGVEVLPPSSGDGGAD